MQVTTNGLREERRERRRRDLRRMKARARRFYWFNSRPEKLANHLAACSCHMCGNPRRYFGEPTLQERRTFVDDEE